MVKAGQDDLGLGGDAESLISGNAGARIACGVIQDGDKWPVEAVALIRGPDKVKGKLRLVQEGPDEPVHIIGTIIGLSEGKHGFHIHEHGSTANR